MTERSPLFLMANLGSEVSKILNAKEKQDTLMFQICLDKAKSILYELKQMREIKDNGEIAILEDLMSDFNKRTPKYNIPKTDWESYFYPFAVRLMEI